MNTIPDDGSMLGALYGSAHIETVLAVENAEKIGDVLDARIAKYMGLLDLDAALSYIEECPEIVYSEEDYEDEGLTKLRQLVCDILARDLLDSWVDNARHRGALIGIGEKCAMTSIVDGEVYKMAVARYGDLLG